MKIIPVPVKTEGLPSSGGRCRVLTFTTLYPSANKPGHGIFVENRLRHLVATGSVDVRVVAPVPWFPSTSDRFGHYAAMARMPAREIRAGIDVAHPRYLAIPKIGMALAPWLLFAGALPSLWRLRSQFDLIDAHYFYPDGVAAVLLGGALDKPVVVTARGTDINLIPKYFLPGRMIRWAARRAAGIVAVSQALKNALADLGTPPENVVVLRNGVDLKMFRPGDRDLARAELELHGRVLLSVGRLVDLKGHAIVMAALPRLPACTLLIAGDGPDFARLRAFAMQLGICDRVRFFGAIRHEQLRNLYLAADALVLASSHEGWPNVLLEAIACGTPVIASPVGGIPEIVSAPEAGILMRQRTVEGVAEAVEQLFSDLPRRENTRAFAERFSWDDTSAGQLRIFEQILARTKNTEANPRAKPGA
jgi:glycosyltransferase involved in cell wall biosynthesis